MEFSLVINMTMGGNWAIVIWIIVGQGPIALAVGVGGGLVGHFTFLCPFPSFSLSLGDGPI